MSRSTPPFDSSRQAPLKIIIVGAGIAGLTLAKALESIPSVHYTVLEARDELAPQEGAGIALAPGGSRILDQLGVYASLEAQMAPVSSSGLYDEKGRMLLPVRSDAAQLVGSRMGYPFGLVERREVVSALLSQISRKDCIKTRKTVLRVEHSRNQSEPITVVCTDGSKFHGDLVVGADGVRSKVRSEMWTAVEQGICGNFDVRRERAALTAEYRCLFGMSSAIEGYEPGCSDDTIGKDVSTMVATTKGGKVFWFLFGRLPRIYNHDEIPRFKEADATEFAQQHFKLPVRENTTMGDLWSRRQKATLVSLEEADFSHWTAGRFVIIGDGAHKMTPQTGAGGMLAIEHAAALANLVNQLSRGHLKGEPTTTRQIETALRHFDTRARHLRTTATIKEAGALARLQALRTFADRIIALLLFRRAGDARADQICGDAIGAERIEYLPLPKRSLSGSMPFNPTRGIGRHEQSWKRALLASTLLLVGYGGFHFMFSVVPLERISQILATNVYQWGEDGNQYEVSLPAQFYRVPLADELARREAMRFIISRIHFLPQNLSLFADYGVWYAIMLIESARRSSRLTLLQCATFWGLLPLIGFSIWIPVYYFVHYITIPLSRFDALDMRLTDLSYTRTVLPVLLVTHYATFVGAYVAPTSALRDTAAFLWELVPLWVFLLQRGLARGVLPSTIQQDRLHNVARDLPAIRRTLITLSVFSAVVWQYALWFGGSSAVDIFVPVIHGVRNLTFEQLFAETMKWDQVFLALANVLWIGLLFSDLRTAGFIQQGWLKLGFYAVALTVVGGNGTMLGVAWLYREEILATRRHRAAVLQDPYNMQHTKGAVAS